MTSTIYVETNQELVSYLVQSGVLKTPTLVAAFRHVDRADFVPTQYLDQAYGDYPLPIGFNQTISQPYTVAFMLELLSPDRGQKILDIGSGSGWTTALLAAVVREKGKVVGTEVVPELVEFGRTNLQKYHFPRAKIILAGKKLGYQKEAPFDRILVSAAGHDLPSILLDQLRIGGRMVIPIEGSVWQIDKKSKTDIAKREFPGFVFVPLKY